MEIVYWLLNVCKEIHCFYVGHDDRVFNPDRP